MTGRGRPRKAKSPEAHCVKSPPRETKQVKPLPKCPGKALVEEKKHDVKEEQKPKKREQKKPKHTDEKPPVSSTKTEEKSIKVKTGAGRGKSPEDFTEEIPKKREPKTPKAITEAPVPQDIIEKKVDGNKILSATLKELKIKTKERSEAASLINRTVKTIMDHLKCNTTCFKDVEDLRTGSYYERLKISNPDEFDVMLTIPIDRVDIKPFSDDGAFYSVALKRGKCCLDPFRKEDGTLPASEILKEFREEVKKSVKKSEDVEVEKKKKGCPAVTLLITDAKGGSVPISLDIVLSLKVKSSWPSFTKDGLQIERWLGTKVKQDYKWKPYYLVSKYEGNGMLESDGVLAKDVWRISFSHVEKGILNNHGSEKTCCEEGGARCCRKDCLKLLKHLLGLLKSEDPSFNKFCSYHAKTTLLHACCSRTKDTEWEASRLNHCFQLLLDNFEGHLRDRQLPNFFIPSQNLLSGPSSKSCTSLARRIKEERDKGFPIFKKR
ncbi:cyclic GMP-AMP synthase [Centroberyx affinis]|uniref:cyclic GMP-AMP synthase n=1 Tax=Centroberyx affinis TaxID=166261 RepID=UPI003A5C3CF6